MPAAAPALDTVAQARLESLGGLIRARRKQCGLSAVATAEAAGMSRVTLHRVERGEPSVTMGAYLNAAEALGLSFQLTEPAAATAPQAANASAVPEHILPADYPQLRRLAWQLPPTQTLTPAQALSLYERNWRHLDTDALQPHERALVQALARTLGAGRLLV